MIGTETLYSATEDNNLTLKVARRPVRLYQLIQFSKSKLRDYNSLISHLAFVTKSNSERTFVLYIKKDSSEYKISNENQWNAFISIKAINNCLFNRSVIKIEYDIIQNKLTEKERQKKLIDKMTIDTFVLSMIKVIDNNPNLSEQIFNLLSQQQLQHQKNDLDNDNKHSQKDNSMSAFDHQNLLIDKFHQIKVKINTLNQIEDSLLSTNYDEEKNKSDNNSSDMPTFNSYYNTESKNSFHCQLLRETLQSNFD